MTRTATDGTVVSDEMYSAIVTAAVGGSSHRVAIVPPQGGERCANCGGVGVMFVDVFDGAYRYPPDGTRPATYHDGKWRTYRRSSFPCPVCGAENAVRCLALLMESSGLNESERDFHLNYIEGMSGKGDALAAARAMLAGTPSPTGWLLLYGDFGRGKSGVLKSLTAALCRANVAARYVTAFDILSEIKATFNVNDRLENEQAIVHRYGAIPCLAVDEIDRVKESQWAMSILFALFEARYRKRDAIATALATNRTPAQLRDDTWGYFESRTRDGLRVEVAGVELRGR